MGPRLGTATVNGPMKGNSADEDGGTGVIRRRLMQETF